MQIRQPAVAGTFYPGSGMALEKDLEGDIPDISEKKHVKGVMAPHAGFVYSGGVAGEVYAGIHIPERVIILCPNHSGLGAPLAIMGEGAWRTPLGDVPIDTTLANQLAEGCSKLEFDSMAHSREHSLEVQLPFLQYLKDDITFVPICLGTSRLSILLELGDAMADTVKTLSEPVLLVASSDMSHFEPESVSRKKDMLAIDEMIALNPEGLHRVVTGERISMCGYAPTVAVMRACGNLGASQGELVRYANSGDVSGDYHSVVGYAGMLFY